MISADLRGRVTQTTAFRSIFETLQVGFGMYDLVESTANIMQQSRGWKTLMKLSGIWSFAEYCCLFHHSSSHLPLFPSISHRHLHFKNSLIKMNMCSFFFSLLFHSSLGQRLYKETPKIKQTLSLLLSVCRNILKRKKSQKCSPQFVHNF